MYRYSDFTILTQNNGELILGEDHQIVYIGDHTVVLTTTSPNQSTKSVGWFA